MNFVNRYFLIALLLLISTFAGAQIGNPGFESWTNDLPDSWLTTNIPGFATPVTRSNDSHSGSYAIRGEVVTTTTGDTMLPVIMGGDFNTGFPVTERYSALTGHYKFSPLGNDEMVILVQMHNGTDLVGAGYVEVFQQTGGYTYFEIPIQYFLSSTPDQCYITIAAGDTGQVVGTPGTWFLIDDLAFNTATGVEPIPASGIPSGFALEQNFPNPFNPSTTIPFSLQQDSEVSLIIYNLSGQEVERLLNGERRPAGNYTVKWSAESLPNGVYFYKLDAGRFSQTRKMILMK